MRDSDCESAAPSFASLALRCDPQISGGVLEEATPDPIPNSEVKLLGADGTAREAVWESRTLPGFFSTELISKEVGSVGLWFCVPVCRR